MNELRGFVYILTNKYNRVLYIGVTRDLRRRVAEHRLHVNRGFTSKYNVEKLVYYEQFDLLDDAIHRESQLKNWRREGSRSWLQILIPSGGIWPRI